LLRCTRCRSSDYVVECNPRTEAAHEAARVHHASRRCDGVAARGRGAARLMTTEWLSGQESESIVPCRALPDVNAAGVVCRFPYNDPLYNAARFGRTIFSLPRIKLRMDVVPHCSQTYDTSTKPFESIISLGSPGIIARLQPGHITTGSVRIRSGRLPLIQYAVDTCMRPAPLFVHGSYESTPSLGDPPPRPPHSWRQKLTPQGTPSPSKAGPPLRPHCLPSNWTAPQVATRCDDS
jgi:hypothetical protein